MTAQRSRGFRAVTLAVALLVPGTGSGVPVCLSMLHQAAEPCPMHAKDEHAAGHHAGHTLAWAPTTPAHSCHTGDLGMGCEAAGACPSTGAAAPVWSTPPAVVGGVANDVAWAPATEPRSFLAPPLSPPPQA